MNIEEDSLVDNVDENIILAVDDEPTNIKIIEHIFSNKYKLKTARDGEEALKLINDFIPSIVLLDIMMPGIDGYEVCKKIREDDRFKHTKVLLVSGKAMIGERLKGYEVGADDFVAKPFDPDELEAKVNVFLDIHHLQKVLSLTNHSLAEEVRVTTGKLLKSEKMAFIGMNSAEIVHNLRNPLAILIYNLKKIYERYPNEVRFKNINIASTRIEETIATILNSVNIYSEDEVRPLNINNILKNELDLLEIGKFYGHQVDLDLQLGELPTFKAVPSHFGQVFGNLIKNSLESMINIKERKLIIETAHLSPLDLDAQIEIKISDNGTGISEQNLENIFMPTFSTKKGDPECDLNGESCNGLGLGFCKSIIELYGGKIEIKSKVNLGTTVIIKLPIPKE